MSALLELRDVAKTYRATVDDLVAPTWTRSRTVPALQGVSLQVAAGQCLAVVGESGSGKTTLGRCALRLVEPSAGSVSFAGEDLLRLSASALRARRRRFQMVFQDPAGALDPRQRAGAAVGEALGLHLGLRGRARRERSAELLALVGLERSIAERFPHELSGGQRQRVAIARALAPEPDLLVADEPVSALDVAVRSQVLNLFAQLQASRQLTLLLIAHDLAMVEQAADEVAVLYLGYLVEKAPASRLFALPLHPYTVTLLSAVPQVVAGSGRGRVVPRGEAPVSAGPPGGCPFHPRCPIARPHCRTEVPPLLAAAPGHTVACFYPGELQPTVSVNFAGG